MRISADNKRNEASYPLQDYSGPPLKLDLQLQAPLLITDPLYQAHGPDPGPHESIPGRAYPGRSEHDQAGRLKCKPGPMDQKVTGTRNPY